MTWIVPKLLISRFAPAMEELISDCAAASQTCEQSLMRRSKPSRANSFLREWKQGNLMRLRSGLISSDSLGKSFEDWWTSYLVGIRASHFPAQESDLEGKTRDTFGRLSQAAFDFFNQESASLKTSRATLPKGCITSCLTWEDWVTEQRGEFSARGNAVRHINGNESSSWPTARTRDWKDTGDLSKVTYGMTLGRLVQANPSTNGSRPESWPTPSALDGVRPQENPAEWAERNAKKKAENPNLGQLHRPLTVAVQQEQWATPRSCSAMAATITPESAIDAKRFPNLETQIGMQERACGKLNPRWVETLMGLPIGWTMPSCTSPRTIASTNCVCSATESSQPPQHSPSKP
jgi:hypothetical protein